jgi:hypothetical protein
VFTARYELDLYINSGYGSCLKVELGFSRLRPHKIPRSPNNGYTPLFIQTKQNIRKV